MKTFFKKNILLNLSDKSLALFFILVITFFVFSPTLFNGITNWDDDVHLVNSPAFRNFNLVNILRTFHPGRLANQTYVPLTTLSFALEKYLFGQNPFVYHFTNLLLHLAVVTSVFYLALRLGISLRAAFLSALLFGIHPMHVESVAWITERKDVLYAIFYMLALYNYVNYRIAGQRKDYFLSLFLCLLSILAKPMALSFPLILFLLDWLLNQPFNKKNLIEKIPYFVIVIPITLITYLQNMRVPGEGVKEGLLIWVYTFVFYLRKFVFPFRLSPLYSLPENVGWQSLPYIFSFMLFIAFLYCAWRFRKEKWFVFGWVYFFLSIFFLLRFDIGHDKSIVADRFMYLPSLGFCFLFGVLGERIWNKVADEDVLYPFFASLFILFCWLTFQQCRVWKNDITLWDYVLKLYPKQIVAYTSRGNAYYRQDKFEEALSDYNKGLEIDPENVELLYNRGIFYSKNGQLGLGLKDFNRAAEVDPSIGKIYNNRGNVFYMLKDYKRALLDYHKAVALDPENARSYYNRGLIYHLQGRYRLAHEDLTQAIKLKPDYISALNLRGELYRSARKFALAVRDYSISLAVEPSQAMVYYQRSLALVGLRNFAGALQDALRVQALGLDIPGMDSYIKNLEMEAQPQVQEFIQRNLLPDM